MIACLEKKTMTQCIPKMYRRVVEDETWFPEKRHDLTGQQPEAAVREHELMLRNLTENFPGFVYTYRRLPDGSEGFSFVSAGCLELCGVEPKALVEDRFRLRNLMSEDERAKFHAAINESARSGEVFHREYRIHHPRKGERWLETRAVPESQPDGSIHWYGVTLDVSDRKTYQLQAELVETAIRHSGEAIYIVDPNREFRFIFVNEAACRMTGYTKAELLAMTPLELDSTVTRQRMLKVTDHLVSEKCLFHEGVHRRKDGSTFPVEIHSFKIVFNGEALRISIIRDITEKKEAARSIDERDQRIRAIFEHSADVAYLVEVTPEGRFVHREINAAFTEACGIPAPQIVGRPVDEIEYKGFRDILIEKYSSCLTAGATVQYTGDYNLPGGRQTYQSTLTPIFDGDGRIHQIAGVARDITELSRAAEAIQERTVELERALAFNYGVINAIPDLLFEIDKTGTYLNAWARDSVLLEEQKEALLGRNIHDFLPPDAAEIAFRTLEEVDRNGSSTGNVYRMNIPGEGERWFELSVAKKEPEGTYLALCRDVSERKQQQDLLQQREREFRTLAENAPDPIYRYDRDCRWIYVNPAVERLTGLAAEELLGKTPVEKRLVAEGYESSALRSIQKVLETAEADTVELCFITPDGRESYYEHTNVPESGPDGSVESVLSIGRDVTAIKGEKALIKELKESEGRYQAKNALLQAVLESSPNIVTFALDQDYHYIAFDRQHAEIMHDLWGKEIVIGGDMLEIMGDHPDREVAKQSFDRALRGESFVVEQEYGDHQRLRSAWESHYAPIVSPAGEILGCTCFNLDVSERKGSEREIALTSARLSTLFEAIPDLIWLKDADGVYQTCNEAYARFLGTSTDDILQKSDSDFYPPAAAQVCRQSDDEAICAGCITFSEEQVTAADGTDMILEIRKTPVYNNTGKLEAVMGIARDIMDRKRMEEALARREQDFRALAENSPDSIARFDLDCRRTYVNPTFKAIFGCKDEDVLGKYPSQTTPIVAHLSQAFENQLRKVLRTGQKLEMEMPFINAAKEQRVGYLRIIPEFGKDGQVISVLSIGQDITERKRMEEILVQQEREFRGMAENSPDTIVRYDQEARAIYVNPTFARLSGATPDELLGKKPVDSNPSGEAAAYQGMLATVLACGEMGEMEYTWPDAQGNRITSHIRVVPEYNGKGEVVSVLATGRDITKLRTIQRQMEHLARHDILTGLPNRQTVREYTNRAIIEANRHGGKVALLFVDLDNFKAINDSLGHATGDTLLKEVAARLQSCVRKNDTVGRQGGDEYVITLCEVENIDSVEEVIARIFRQFELPVPVAEYTLFISVSIGIAIYPDDGNNFYTLLKSADTAMYDAKEAGRNTYSFFSGEMNQTTLEHLHLHSDLKNALNNDELILHYQPQIDAGTGRITGAEALLRWQHPEKGMIPPMSFIPVAEANGLIVPIGEWVLREACRQAARWRDGGGDPLSIAVNISAMQFKRGNLEETVFSALEQSGLAPERLDLELTESILIHNPEQTLEMVKRLKARGIRISIDDFGTGYSSMSYLKRFAADTLKIDRSFVRDIVDDNDDTAIVRAIIQMAKSLGIATVAEGVEEQTHLDMLKELGCDLIQGFFISRPLSKTDFDTFCAEWNAWK